jgi:uncharacterized protein
MSTANVRRVSGLETWFELPGRTAPAPPRWKMFVVTAVVIFVLRPCLSVVLPRVAPGCVAGSPRRVHRDRRYVADDVFVQPRLALLLEGWLYSPRRSGPWE